MRPRAGPEEKECVPQEINAPRPRRETAPRPKRRPQLQGVPRTASRETREERRKLSHVIRTWYCQIRLRPLQYTSSRHVFLSQMRAQNQ